MSNNRRWLLSMQTTSQFICQCVAWYWFPSSRCVYQIVWSLPYYICIEAIEYWNAFFLNWNCYILHWRIEKKTNNDRAPLKLNWTLKCTSILTYWSQPTGRKSFCYNFCGFQSETIRHTLNEKAFLEYYKVKSKNLCGIGNFVQVVSIF